MNQNQPNNEKKHNYFYKITNLINGKYYYGIRSTNKEIDNDNYWGSGTTIIFAIKKHGKENFIKEIIADYPTRKEASEHEQIIVTLELIQLEECYNIKTGGDNGFTYSQEECQKISIRQTGDKNSFKGKQHSDETKLKISNAMKGINNPFYGKKHTDETCERLRIANSGSNNPLFGKKLSDEIKKKMSNAHIGKIFSEQHRKNMSEVRKGRKHTEDAILRFRANSKFSKPCRILGINYISISEATRQLKTDHDTITRRIKSTNPKWSEWKFI